MNTFVDTYNTIVRTKPIITKSEELFLKKNLRPEFSVIIDRNKENYIMLKHGKFFGYLKNDGFIFTAEKLERYSHKQLLAVCDNWNIPVKQSYPPKMRCEMVSSILHHHNNFLISVHTKGKFLFTIQNFCE